MTLGPIGIALCIFVAMPGTGFASCLAPAVPFAPSEPAERRIYADLIRTDFEAYFSEVQAYFRCIDAERAQVFSSRRRKPPQPMRVFWTLSGETTAQPAAILPIPHEQTNLLDVNKTVLYR